MRVDVEAASRVGVSSAQVGLTTTRLGEEPPTTIPEGTSVVTVGEVETISVTMSRIPPDIRDARATGREGERIGGALSFIASG